MTDNVTFTTGVGATVPAATVIETIDQGAGVQRQVVANYLTGVGTVAVANPELAGRVPTLEPDALLIASASVSSAATIFTQDTIGYSSIDIQFTSIGSGNTVSFEGSDDNTNWITTAVQQANSVGSTNPTTSTAVNTTSSYRGAVIQRYFRARVSTYGSGTVTALGYLRKTSFSFTQSGVQGTVASGATDANNPVKVGGVFNTTAPTVTTGQRVDFQANARGAQLVEQGPFLLGRAVADTQIKATAGFIHTISIAPLTATPTAGLLTVYDNTAESGTVVYAEWIFATTPGHTVTLNVPCGTGIYVGFDATLANVQATLSYR